MAVKPNYVTSVLKDLSSAVRAHTLIVSIAAGVPTFVIEKVGGASDGVVVVVLLLLIVAQHSVIATNVRG